MVAFVKDAKLVAPASTRDLVGSVRGHEVEGGPPIMLNEPTGGMIELADHSGTYEVPMTGTTHPRTQILIGAEVPAAKRPKIPTPILPYIEESRRPGSEAVPLSWAHCLDRRTPKPRTVRSRLLSAIRARSTCLLASGSVERSAAQ